MLKTTVTCLFACATLAAQTPKATPESAQNLVKKAIIFAQKAGPDRLVMETNGGIFHVNSGSDLYLSVYSTSGTILAVGFNGKVLAGKPCFTIKDGGGKFFLKEVFAKVKANGSCWHEYKWNNPATNQMGTKRAYFEEAKGQDIIVTAGCYK